MIGQFFLTTSNSVRWRPSPRDMVFLFSYLLFIGGFAGYICYLIYGVYTCLFVIFFGAAVVSFSRRWRSVELYRDEGNLKMPGLRLMWKKLEVDKIQEIKFWFYKQHFVYIRYNYADVFIMGTYSEDHAAQVAAAIGDLVGKPVRNLNDE